MTQHNSPQAISQELDDLEADLRKAADTWFRDALMVKLFRLITLAREGQQAVQAYERMLAREATQGMPGQRLTHGSEYNSPLSLLLPPKGGL